MKRFILPIAALLLSCGLFAQNPVIKGLYSADPTARVFNGKVYLFPSHDIISPVEPERKWFCMEDYHVFSSEDLVNWTDHGVILDQKNVPWGNPEGYSMWAPDCVERNGKYYLYYPTDVKYIGVAVSDHPWGPFEDPLGHPLLTIDSPGVVCDRDFIDPCVFIDDDGQAYMFVGQNTCCCIKLNEDNTFEIMRQ